ncbi:MAG: hypothetical protein NTW58_12115 [Actinobacteria bacterium]|nr:hypothetical protein [Actinomycetota bacterium]
MEYAVLVGGMRLNGSRAGLEMAGAEPGLGRLASTACLVIVLLAAFIVLVVLPIALWLLGIAFGGS